MKIKKLTIIIPAYNEEKYILHTIKKILKAESLGMQKEIIIIDDGSTDDTPERIKDAVLLVSKKKDVSIISRLKAKNEGKGAAMKDGFILSTGDIVLVQDADMEYSPEDYPTLLFPFIHNDADVVFGSRFISDRPHRVLYFWHSIMNQFLTMFSNMLSNLNLTDMETGSKVFKGDLIRTIAPRLSAKRFGFEPEITARIAKIPQVKIYEVGVSYAGRTYQEGKKIGWIDGVKAIGEIVRYNLFP